MIIFWLNFFEQFSARPPLFLKERPTRKLLKNIEPKYYHLAIFSVVKSIQSHDFLGPPEQYSYLGLISESSNILQCCYLLEFRRFSCGLCFSGSPILTAYSLPPSAASLCIYTVRT